MRSSVVVVLIALLSAAPMAPPVQAQTAHAAPQSALDGAIQAHVAAGAADRAAILRVLQLPEVKALAGTMGVDLRRASSAVATLDGAEMAALAAQARQVEDSLAGGQSRVTVSTTMIIIGLLILILIIVAVD